MRVFEQQQLVRGSSVIEPHHVTGMNKHTETVQFREGKTFSPRFAVIFPLWV